MSLPVVEYHIATTFCTFQDSTAVVPCAQFHSDNFTATWMRARWYFPQIWMKESFIEWAPGFRCDTRRFSVWCISTRMVWWLNDIIRLCGALPKTSDPILSAWYSQMTWFHTGITPPAAIVLTCLLLKSDMNQIVQGTYRVMTFNNVRYRLNNYASVKVSEIG